MADNPNHIKTTLRQKTNDGIDSTKEIYPKTTIDQLYNEAGTTHFNDESFSKPFVAGTGIDFTAVPDSLVGAKTISVDLTDLKATILDMLYPVGSIYMSVSTGTGGLCPIQVGLGGTWTQLKDTFLLAHGDTYTSIASADNDTVTAEDGSPDAILVSHSHTGATDTHTADITINNDGKSLSFAVMGGAKSGSSDNEQTLKEHSGATVSKSGAWRARGIDLLDSGTWDSYKLDYDGQHSHSVTDSGHTHTITPEGVDGTGKNMPPYLVVYMWKRTA